MNGKGSLVVLVLLGVAALIFIGIRMNSRVRNENVQQLARSSATPYTGGATAPSHEAPPPEPKTHPHPEPPKPKKFIGRAPPQKFATEQPSNGPRADSEKFVPSGNSSKIGGRDKDPAVALGEDPLKPGAIQIEGVDWQVTDVCVDYKEATSQLPDGYYLPTVAQVTLFRKDAAVRQRFPRLFAGHRKVWTRDQPDIAPWRWAIELDTGNQVKQDGEVPACLVEVAGH